MNYYRWLACLKFDYSLLADLSFNNSDCSYLCSLLEPTIVDLYGHKLGF